MQAFRHDGAVALKRHALVLDAKLNEQVIYACSIWGSTSLTVNLDVQSHFLP